MAQITFTGNLGSDPELRFTPGGKAVVSLSVADGLRRKNQQTGEWEDVSTTWWRVQAWDDLAEALAAALHKGARVRVSGEVHAREWEDREGAKRTSYDVTVRRFDDVTTLVPKSGQGGQRGGQQQAQGDPWGAPAGASASFDQAPPF